MMLLYPSYYSKIFKGYLWALNRCKNNFETKVRFGLTLVKINKPGQNLTIQIQLLPQNLVMIIIQSIRPHRPASITMAIYFNHSHKFYLNKHQHFNSFLLLQSVKWRWLEQFVSTRNFKSRLQMNAITLNCAMAQSLFIPCSWM